MGNKHEEIIDQTKKYLHKIGGRAWQTYPGIAWKGQARRNGSTVILNNAVAFEAHTEGEPDLHAYIPKTITQEMVGKTVLLFAKIEVKTEKQMLTHEQRIRLEYITANGGYGLMIRPEEGINNIYLISKDDAGEIDGDINVIGAI
jgi:hypothetical protein